MNTEGNNQDGATPEDGGEGASAKIEISKEEYDQLKANEVTLGSTKRDLKNLRKEFDELKKPKEVEESKETPKNQAEEFGLLQRTFLGQQGIVEDDEVDRAKELQKETGLSWEKLTKSNYFKSEMQAFKDSKANAEATDVKGGESAPSGAKDTVEYWAQKGTLPDVEDIPDRKTRAKVINALAERERQGGHGKFYNE